jgi:hypothetical protein
LAPASTASRESQFDKVIGWIPKSFAICSSVTPSSRFWATLTTSSRNSFGYGFGIPTSFQARSSSKPDQMSPIHAADPGCTQKSRPTASLTNLASVTRRRLAVGRSRRRFCRGTVLLLCHAAENCRACVQKSGRSQSDCCRGHRVVLGPRTLRSQPSKHPPKTVTPCDPRVRAETACGYATHSPQTPSRFTARCPPSGTDMSHQPSDRLLGLSRLKWAA